MLVDAFKLSQVVSLLLEHFGADGAGVVEGGVHEGIVIIGGGVSAGVGAGADKVETFPARFTRVVGSRVAFFDLEAAFEARPAHCGHDMSGAASGKSR